MKAILSAITAFGVLGALASVGLSQEPQKATVKYACVVFDHTNNPTLFQGKIDSTQFQKWFRENYDVDGDMGPEIPKNATAFGALALTDGNDILLMPLYTWTSDEKQFFACRGDKGARAPMFCVIQTSREAFFRSMQARLKEIGKAEQ